MLTVIRRAALQILERHVLQERRFRRAGLADQVQVQEMVFVLDSEDALVAANMNPCEVSTNIGLIICSSNLT